MSRQPRPIIKLCQSSELKHSIYYECLRQTEALYVRLDRRFVAEARGDYGVDAFEQHRLENRRKYERFHPTKKLKQSAHAEVREQAVVGLVAALAAELGTSVETVVDPDVVRAAVSKPGVREECIRLHPLDSVLRSAELRRGDGPCGTLGELFHVVMNMGMAELPDGAHASHPALARYACVAESASHLSRVHAALGEEFMRGCADDEVDPEDMSRFRDPIVVPT